MPIDLAQDAVIYLVGIVLFIGVMLSPMSGRFGIPGLVFFLGIGMVLGSDILGWVYFDDAEMARLLSSMALIIILFEGGLKTEWKQVKPIIVPSTILATLGVVLTAALIGLSAYWVTDLSLVESMLLGAIIGSTDAAAVFAVIGNMRIQPRVKYTLEAESALNDPMAIVLTMALVAAVTGVERSIGSWALIGLWQLVAGAAMGYLLGKLGARLLSRNLLDNSALYPVLAVATAILVHGLTAAVGASGFMAVYIYGTVLGNSPIAFRQNVVRFQDGLSWMAHILMFAMLGLLVFPSQLLDIAMPSMLIVVMMALIARPVVVMLCTIGFGYSIQEKIFMFWGGLKGSVPIILATFPFVAGYERSTLVFNIIFFVVLTSALLQGASLQWAARKLRLDLPSIPTPLHAVELVTVGRSNLQLIHAYVDEGSPSVGETLQSLQLPQEAVVSAISRGDKMIVPRGDTRIESGDFMFIMAAPTHEEEVLALLTGGEGGESEERDGNRAGAGAEGAKSGVGSDHGTGAADIAGSRSAATAGTVESPDGIATGLSRERTERPGGAESGVGSAAERSVGAEAGAGASTGSGAGSSAGSDHGAGAEASAGSGHGTGVEAKMPGDSVPVSDTDSTPDRGS